MLSLPLLEDDSYWEYFARCATESDFAQENIENNKSSGSR